MTARHLAGGRQFDLVKADIANDIRGRLLVGHSIEKDLRVLGLSHPKWNRRDIATYPPFATVNIDKY